MFRPEFEKRNIKFKLQIDSESQVIRADRNQVQQVLLNLVKNSMEALESIKDPMLMIRSFREEDQIVVLISDNGTGIDPEIIDEIFVPFYTTKPQGSGIGLSLARQVMRMHGGNIRITSGKGEGTMVYLDFQG